MTDLFDPFDLSGLALPNRIAMSAMTRTRAGEDGVPTDLMRDYYVQRASAGLVVTECTQVSDQGHGIIRAPGIHRADQVDGWKKITSSSCRTAATSATTPTAAASRTARA